MSHEHQPTPRPYEVFGITEDEVGRWRIPDEKLTQILSDPNTTITKIRIDSNNYGEFLFLTASRGFGAQRTCMTFWGLGFHEYRERWIHQEWFWHQTPTSLVDPLAELAKEEAFRQIQERRDEIAAEFGNDLQSETGHMFETLADLTDDDAALAEMQDLGLL